jgi:hypothetical protein
MPEFYRQREPQITFAPTALNKLTRQVLHLTRSRWSDMPQQPGSNGQDAIRLWREEEAARAGRAAQAGQLCA